MSAKEPPDRRSHRLSAAVYCCTGYEFFFTICARHQGKPFENESLAKAVIDSLLWTKEKYSWLLYGYCLMPDHLHFVCRLTEKDVRLVNGGARGFQPEGVLDHLGRFKSFTTNHSWKLGYQNELWQRSSYDRVFDMQWAFEEIVQYVLENPVRKRLVSAWNQWPYSAIVDRWEASITTL